MTESLDLSTFQHLALWTVPQTLGVGILRRVQTAEVS